MSHKNTKRNIFLTILGNLIVAILLTSCNIPTQQVDNDDLVNNVVMTMQAQATQSAFETLVSQLTQVSQITPSSTFTIIPTDTATLLPPTYTATMVPPTNTATSIPPTSTNTKLPPTNTPYPTPTPIPCNIAHFVKDVTVPDGTSFASGEHFTKTWRLKNVGTCSWTTDYDLVFVSGNAMNALSTIALPVKVKPGEMIDLSAEMVAPSKQGEYTGFWMLRSANGARFGVGKDAQFSFWVKIKVVEGPYEVFSFAENKCSAVWSSGSSNPLACPGKETDIISGYVLSKDHPYRESGALENEIGLITRPNNSSDGWIQGIYPAYKVKEGDVFKAAVNCEYGSSHCDVYFELRYRIAGGDIHTLGSWHEIYEGLWKNVSVDLSSLVGKDVQFILFVKNGATAQDNKALWIRPSIWRD